MKKYSSAIPILILFSIVVWFIYTELEIRDLLTNYYISTAKVYKCNKGGKGSLGSLFIYYEYYEDGKICNGSSSLGGDESFSLQDCRTYIVNRTFPVAISSKESKFHSSMILIVPKNFKRFRLNYPDSLNWVLKHTKGYKNHHSFR